MLLFIFIEKYTHIQISSDLVMLFTALVLNSSCGTICLSRFSDWWKSWEGSWV